MCLVIKGAKGVEISLKGKVEVGMGGDDRYHYLSIVVLQGPLVCLFSLSLLQ